jgi:hypothetical protein
VGKAEEKRPIGRPRHRWVYILKVYKLFIVQGTEGGLVSL